MSADERTVYACSIHALYILFSASVDVWRRRNADLSTVRLVVGPTLAPGNEEEFARVAFAYELRSGDRISYADDSQYGLIEMLSEHLVRVDALTGDGRTDVVTLSAALDGELDVEMGGLGRDLLFRMSGVYGFDLDHLYSVGDFCIKGFELRGDAYPLDGEEPVIERASTPAAEFTLEALIRDRFGPPRALDRFDRFRMEETFSILSVLMPPFRPTEDEMAALRAQYQ